jgi:hypothetical protein
MKYEYWLIALTVLQIGDLLTTKHILENGGRELNPVMAYLFKKFGVTKTLISKVIFVFCIGVVLLKIMPASLIILVGVYVGVVAWNSYQIWGKK